MIKKVKKNSVFKIIVAGLSALAVTLSPISPLSTYTDTTTIYAETPDSVAVQTVGESNVPVYKNFIPQSSQHRPGTPMTPKYITIHNTGNNAAGADADMHARYLAKGKTNETYISWHFTVDDHQIDQHLPINEIGYHAGDGRGQGNMASIGIEICENADGNYRTAESNAEDLVAELLFELGMDVSQVVQHNHWSGKNCPQNIRETTDGSVGWEQFLANINTKLSSLKEKQVQVLKAASIEKLGSNASIKTAEVPTDNAISIRKGDTRALDVYTTQPSHNYQLTASSTDGWVVNQVSTDSRDSLLGTVSSSYTPKFVQSVKLIESTENVENETDTWNTLLKDKEVTFIANSSFFNTETRIFESTGLSFITVEKSEQSWKFAVYNYINQAPTIMFKDLSVNKMKSSFDLLASNKLEENREWKVEDESIAKIDNGKIKGINEGKTNVYVQLGDYILTREVKVEQ